MTAASHYAALRMAVLAEVPALHAEELRFGRAIARDLALPLDVTKAILRDLRNDGLILLSPVCDWDGMPNGSGWIRTRTGEEHHLRSLADAGEAVNV
ncbi:MAG: hypothetical protein VR71_01985 [Roseovarius sp. BRH_c41]|uniref:hypothetical protein n=1 Tax=Roseovarius sp. BRH_c41 TaxID=1629709 RepID=UPI0005F236B4|nr:hypothetical protein [Roseovarius sp. BRH_c41]KJS45209.1 MAG: hypothetical protein VR71_01985 [Roseovarius sp. BRH_c41]